MAPLPKQGRKIALVGASGTIGAPTLAALVADGIHSITVISRDESKATFPAGVNVKRGSYEDLDFLTSAMKGHDTLVLMLSIPAMKQQGKFIEAAAAAGVKTVFPTEFGSDPDENSSKLVKENPLISEKKVFRDQAHSLGLRTVIVVNNPWFDWSLARGLWGVDIANRRATLFDGGNARFVTTKLETTGRATASLLGLSDAHLFPDGGNTRVAYFKSYHVNQRDILASAQRATGTTEADWDIKVVDAAEAIRAAREEKTMEAGIRAFYVYHMREGWGGDYSAKVGKTMEELGVVEQESLDDAVRRVAKEIGGK